MQMPSSTKTEHRALNALEQIIDKHLTMDHQFNATDKEMSWDGYIWLYKENNGEQSKPNFDSRVPVQIKGHYDSTHEYCNKNRISYSVDVDDLRVYASEKGVLYFQIFVDKNESEIFYTSLYPSKIADYLDLVSKKKKQKTKKIPFVKLEKDPDKLFYIVKQFSDEAKKQGSAYTPLVQDRIRLNDFNKLTSLNLTVVGATDPISMLHRLSSGDICFYGKTKDDKYLRPLEWRDESVFFMSHDVEQSVALDNTAYYDHYKCIADSNGGMTLVISPNLQLRLNEGKIDFTVTSTIREIGYDAKFLLQFKKSDTLSISTQKFEITNPTINADFEDTLRFIVDLYETLEMVGFDVDTRISQYTEQQQIDFEKLVKLRNGALNNQISEGFSRYNWKIGGKYYPLLIEKHHDVITLTDTLYSDKFAYFIPCPESTDERGFKMPLFIYHEVEILGNLYRYDYGAFRQQIDSSDCNKYTAGALLQCVLTMINVFDDNSDENFLDLADYLLKNLQPYLLAEVFLINELQIKIRKRDLSEEDIGCLNRIENDQPKVQFSKYVLLENKTLASYYYALFSEDDIKEYLNYPIYTLYNKL